MKTKKHRRVWLGFDRILSKSLLKQLAILLAVLVAALLLSYLMLALSGSDWRGFCQANDLEEWLLPLYLLIDSNALSSLYVGGHVHGWMLFASSLTFLFGAFVFNGIIIGIITNSIEQRVEDYRQGRLHYLKSGHYIIMGYDAMVPSIITSIFSRDSQAYVLLMGASEAESVREKLRKRFDEQRQKHIIINYGHRTSADYYADIHLEGAEEVFVVGNHSKAAHDAINVECVDSICRYLECQQQRPARITCVFKDLDTYAAFKTAEIFKKARDLDIEFVPYNFFTGWAKQVFVKRYYRDFDDHGRKYEYPSVFGEKGLLPGDKRYAHLVFVGTTNFAVAFAMEAAHVLHFPNFDTNGARTRITFIDINADFEKDEFITRNRHFFEVQEYIYRDLSASPKPVAEETGRENLVFTEEEGYGKDDANFLDVEFEFIKGNVFSKQVQDEISRWASRHNQEEYLSIFLAMADQRQNFVMGMNMPDEVYAKAVPVFIRQDRSDNFVTNLRHADRDGGTYTYARVEDGQLQTEQRMGRYANIYPFGMNETAFSADDHSLRRAKLINYLYATADYATCRFQSVKDLDDLPEKCIWCKADDYWQRLSVAYQWSNLYNSYTIRTKLRTLRAMRGLDLEDPSRDQDPLTDEEARHLAIVEHNRWNVEKLLMGYRKPRKGEDKYACPTFADELKKNKQLFIHHDIRPFGQLNTIKELDYEFSRYIPWLMRMTEK